MRFRQIRLCMLSLLCVILACGPTQDLHVLTQADYVPPTFDRVCTLDSNRIELIFDETAYIDPDQITITPALAIQHISDPDTSVTITTETQTPGKAYSLRTTAEDARRNSVSFRVGFYGFNPQLPQVLINEFTTKGAGKHPDMVELYVGSAGNMAGVVLYQGTAGNWEDRIIFPAFPVKTGDYIVVHFKPQGGDEEKNEVTGKSISGGFDATPSAFDFWVDGATGLSGNNGIISLYQTPNGRMIDGVLYSNRTSQSDERYRGFGTKDVLERAEELVREGGWQITGEMVTPEDAVNPEKSTSTRSICREGTSTDTDSKDDWHIVPTRGSSFGKTNSNERYQQ